MTLIGPIAEAALYAALVVAGALLADRVHTRAPRTLPAHPFLINFRLWLIKREIRATRPDITRLARA